MMWWLMIWLTSGWIALGPFDSQDACKLVQYQIVEVQSSQGITLERVRCEQDEPEVG